MSVLLCKRVSVASPPPPPFLLFLGYLSTLVEAGQRETRMPASASPLCLSPRLSVKPHYLFNRLPSKATCSQLIPGLAATHLNDAGQEGTIWFIQFVRS